MKLTRPSVRRSARKAGGLFVGIRYSFPCGMCSEVFPMTHWQSSGVCIGLLLWTFSFNIEWGHCQHEDGC